MRDIDRLPWSLTSVIYALNAVDLVAIRPAQGWVAGRTAIALVESRPGHLSCVSVSCASGRGVHGLESPNDATRGAGHSCPRF